MKKINAMWYRGAVELVRRHRLAAAIVATLFCGVIGLMQAGLFASARYADIVVDPVDTRVLVAGLEKTPLFFDTLGWWHGPWVAGSHYAFYRPLSSLLWWVEFHFFGRHALGIFSLVHGVSHLLMLVVALLFLRRLFGLRSALATMCCYALSLQEQLFRMPSASFALPVWKDDPDMWMFAAVLFSLSKFVDYLRFARRRDIFISLAFFALAITFKEMAYVLPLLLLPLLWHERRLPQWRAAAPFFAMAAVAFTFRFWALGGMGFRFGSNGSWFLRWFTDVGGGEPAAFVTLGSGLPFVIAGLIGAALFYRAKTPVVWPLLSLSLAFLSGCYAVLWWRTMEYAIIYMIFDGHTWRDAMVLLFYGFLWWRVLARRSRAQLFGWFWVLATYAPLMTAPITQHAQYSVALGWSLWLTLALLDLAALAREWWAKLRPSLARLRRKKAHEMVKVET